MLKSMTGFAAQSGGDDTARWDWEVRAVNGKGMDLRLRLPDGAEALEPVLRKAAAAIKRGNVTVSLKLQRVAGVGAGVVDTAGLAAAIAAIQAAEDAASAAHLGLAPTTAAAVLGLPGVMRYDNTRGELPAAIGDGIGALFADFDAMRRNEGAAMGKVLAGQLAQIADLVTRAAASAEARDAAAGRILSERVDALLSATDKVEPARLQQELAILAVKSDVTEEIDRLRAHVAAAQVLLSDGGVVGRKLDFLMQEFNREANTLCSKAGSTDLTAIGLELKVIIDQMREQVQNLE